jgi:metal-dependent hydrolase (beta-lactamase superfamily II)
VKGAEATQNIERPRALGVASVSATHCTGDLPMRLFAKAYGSQSATAGADKRIVLD